MTAGYGKSLKNT